MAAEPVVTCLCTAEVYRPANSNRSAAYSQQNDLVLLGNGNIMKAIGSTTLRCSFAQGTPQKLLRKFLVFDRLLPGVRVLLGDLFLAFTKTMTEYCGRLKVIKQTKELNTQPRMMNMSLAGQEMRCYLGSVLAIAAVDTGSEINLMRTDYAMLRILAVQKLTPLPNA